MRFIDISFYFWIGLASYFFVIPQRAYAFSKIINGLESITTSYLVPLAGAVAGASFILFVTMSYFKQEEYQRKIVNVLILAVITGAGLEMVKKVIQHFS